MSKESVQSSSEKPSFWQKLGFFALFLNMSDRR